MSEPKPSKPATVTLSMIARAIKDARKRLNDTAEERGYSIAGLIARYAGETLVEVTLIRAIDSRELVYQCDGNGVPWSVHAYSAEEYGTVISPPNPEPPGYVPTAGLYGTRELPSHCRGLVRCLSSHKCHCKR